MALSTALNSAISGLQLSSRGAQVVADNIANTNTEGYGVRSIAQAARVTGSTGNGVMLTGILRETDPTLLGEFRTANARHANDSFVNAFWGSLEEGVGAPGTPGALTTRMTALETALDRAIVQPESRAMLHAVAQSASSVAAKVRDLSAALHQARDDADARIARDVDRFNTLLQQISGLNKDIQRQTLKGETPNSLLDQRQGLIDQASAIVPLTEIPRGNGRIMLLGEGGTILLDSEPALLEFRRTLAPAANETVDNAALSRLSVDGREIADNNSLLGAGSLAGAFRIRDQDAPAMQKQLDQISVDLVTRFVGNATDATLAPGEFGLFTLSGLTAIPAETNGLAGRIQLTSQIDINAPDTLWRLRDGLFATANGPASDNTVLVGLKDALTMSSQLSAPDGPHASALGHMGALLSDIASRRLAAETDLSQSVARRDGVQQSLRMQGVDSDAELQKLLVLEKSYAANARVIAAVDGMLRQLLEL